MFWGLVLTFVGAKWQKLVGGLFGPPQFWIELTPSSLWFILTFTWFLKNVYWSLAIPVCFLNSLRYDEYSNLLAVAAISNSHYSGKASLPIKDSYLISFSDN